MLVRVDMAGLYKRLVTDSQTSDSGFPSSTVTNPDASCSLCIKSCKEMELLEDPLKSLLLSQPVQINALLVSFPTPLRCMRGLIPSLCSYLGTEGPIRSF